MESVFAFIAVRFYDILQSIPLGVGWIEISTTISNSVFSEHTQRLVNGIEFSEISAIKSGTTNQASMPYVELANFERGRFAIDMENSDCRFANRFEPFLRVSGVEFHFSPILQYVQFFLGRWICTESSMRTF